MNQQNYQNVYVRASAETAKRSKRNLLRERKALQLGRSGLSGNGEAPVTVCLLGNAASFACPAGFDASLRAVLRAAPLAFLMLAC